jgi:hypothetical protein
MWALHHIHLDIQRPRSSSHGLLKAEQQHIIHYKFAAVVFGGCGIFSAARYPGKNNEYMLIKSIDEFTSALWCLLSDIVSSIRIYCVPTHVNYHSLCIYCHLSWYLIQRNKRRAMLAVNGKRCDFQQSWHVRTSTSTCTVIYILLTA